ncbi:hypothetical protein TNCV_3684331 [Trichonephila clavipes]|uniref:Uncharacterized protein n=1 Tax=Trichonephila clavipes TaxID=2585209 RepID=A0A8X6RHI0_TRICX|nr:hypothetical protein TNCV_3684331 [Trichonephila clavipes]
MESTKRPIRIGLIFPLKFQLTGSVPCNLSHVHNFPATHRISLNETYATKAQFQQWNQIQLPGRELLKRERPTPFGPTRCLQSIEEFFRLVGFYLFGETRQFTPSSKPFDEWP